MIGYVEIENGNMKVFDSNGRCIKNDCGGHFTEKLVSCNGSGFVTISLDSRKFYDENGNVIKNISEHHEECRNI